MADIVVEENWNKSLGGQWRFVKQDSSGIGRLLQQGLRRCILDVKLDVMVRETLNGEEMRDPDRRFGPMNLKFKLGKLVGERFCLTHRSIMKTLVRGTVEGRCCSNPMRRRHR
ncbi:hypothetical protein [Sphingomonas sp. R86521]|uniref:hypothetical protein n=1 Tax=Sphingomonas sp. R86521 TaxID=3093860 RepID=UPI0036D41EA0